ncbi:unnamed protein product [Closterium sp. NIES-54]
MLCFWQLTTEACRHVSSILEDHFEGLNSNFLSVQHLTEQVTFGLVNYIVLHLNNQCLVLGAEAGRQMLVDFNVRLGKHPSREENEAHEGDEAYKVELEKLSKNLQRVFMLTKFFQNNAIRVALLYPAEACDQAASEDMTGLLFAYAGLLHYRDGDGRCADGSVQKANCLKWPVLFQVADALAQVLGPTLFGLVHNILNSEKVSASAKANLILQILPAAGSGGPPPQTNMIWRVVSSAGVNAEGSMKGGSCKIIGLDQHSPEMAEWQSCGRLVTATTVLEGASSYSDQVLNVVTNNLDGLISLAADQHSYIPLLSRLIWPFSKQRKEGTDTGAAAAAAGRTARQVVLFSQLNRGLKVLVAVIGARVTSLREPASRDVEQNNIGYLALWEEVEAFLFQNAVHPHPICAELVRDTWCFLIRHSDPQLARSHAQLLLRSVQASLQTTVKNESKPQSNGWGGSSTAVLLGNVTGVEEWLVCATVDVLMACPDATVSDVFLKPFVWHINSSFSKFSASAGTASAVSQHSRTATSCPPKSMNQEIASVLALSLLLERGMAAGIHRRQPAALLPIARACFGAARAATTNIMANASRDVTWEQVALLGSMLTSITAVLRERAESSMSGTSGLPAVFPNTKDLVKLAADAATLHVPSDMVNGAHLIGSSRHGQLTGSGSNRSSSPYSDATMIDLDRGTKEKLNGGTQQPLLARAALLLAAVSRTSDGISVADVEPVLRAMLHVLQRVHCHDDGFVGESWSGARMLEGEVAAAAALLFSQLFASSRTLQELIHKPVALELLHTLLFSHHLPAAYSSLSALHAAMTAYHSSTGMDTRKYTILRKVLPQSGSGTVLDVLMKPGWTPEEAEQELSYMFHLQQHQQKQQQQQQPSESRIHALRAEGQVLQFRGKCFEQKLSNRSEPLLKGNVLCIDLDSADGNDASDVRMERRQDAELVALPQRVAEANSILEAVLACVRSKPLSGHHHVLLEEFRTHLATSNRLINELNNYASNKSRQQEQAAKRSSGGFEGSIYLHHSDVGRQVNSAALSVGLIHALQVLRPGVGYFRPIDQTSHGGNRVDLMKKVFHINTPPEDMYALTQDQAYSLLAADKIDDLLEAVISAYERHKRHHDFVVVEGTSMRDGSNTSPINGLIASALECPALLLTDCIAASHHHPKHHEAGGQFEAWDFEKEATSCILDHARIMRQSSVDIAGALLYRTPRTSRGTTRLRQYISEAGIPFLGALPADKSLESFQVEDVRRVLHAQVLYGEDTPHAANSMATEITKTMVATLHLAEILTLIPPSDDPARGALVIAHASRPDILLGMIDLHETHLSTQVAAMVLTGGAPPPAEVDELIRTRPTRVSLPVLLAPKATYDTCLELAKADSELHATSTRKIERAEVMFHEHVDMRVLNQVLFKERPLRMNPKLFQHGIFEKARAAQSHVVLPEGAEPRTVQAAGEVLRRSLCQLTLVGKPDLILTQAKQLRVDLTGANIVNPASAPNLETYVDILYEARKSKGMTRAEAQEVLITDANYFGTAMVAAGDADGMVSGAIHTTANTVRPALQIIKTLPETPIVSSVFFMCLPDKVLVYGDCAINTNPTAEELAMIAMSSADTAAAFGVEPRVALLSYATGDSNTGPLIQKVADATAIVHERRPDLMVEGPLQYDAAVNMETAKTKLKGRTSEVAGQASVLIFPDLNTGNNTYKAVQQSTGAVAMGPVLQGLRRPVNDLSRGCTVKDIVTTIAITGVQAAAMKTSSIMQGGSA